MGLDITLQRVQAYRVFENGTIITVSQLFPVTDVEDFTVSPQRAQIRAAEERRTRSREGRTVVRLVKSLAIPDGTALILRPPTGVGADLREAVDPGVAHDPPR